MAYARSVVDQATTLNGGRGDRKGQVCRCRRCGYVGKRSDHEFPRFLVRIDVCGDSAFFLLITCFGNSRAHRRRFAIPRSGGVGATAARKERKSLESWNCHRTQHGRGTSTRRALSGRSRRLYSIGGVGACEQFGSRAFAH